MAAESTKRLGVIIVNFRTARLVEQCLASLDGEVDPERDVTVVVDNASNDGSAEAIERTITERGWNGWARLVRSPLNGGFSAGNNVGIRSIEAASYLLLNSDTIVRPGALAEMLGALELHKDVGLLGPRLEWPDGTPQESVFRPHTAMSEFIRAANTGPITALLDRYVVARPAQPSPVDFAWTSFACVLIRRSVFDQIGLLDEGYFMYYEDADFCRRAVAAGHRTLHWPAARVVHLRGGSGPVKELSAARKRRPTYFYAARNRYFARAHGAAGAWAANLAWCAGRGISLAREILGGKPTHVCAREATDIWTNALHPLRPAAPVREAAP